MLKISCKQILTAGLLLASVCLLGACTRKPAAVKEVSIVPLAGHWEKAEGVFVLKSNATIGVTDDSLLPAAEYLASLLSPATGYALPVKAGEGTLTLALGEVPGNEGAYTLVADKSKVTITGNAYAGVVAGIQSLRQLFPAAIESRQKASGTKWAIPAVSMQDAPRYGWRGIMLDVSRHFYSKEEVENLLDIMALYKMNKFHWHLTDDQGWRIEIKKYPLLTEKGAWRPFNAHDLACIRRSKEEGNPDLDIPADKIQTVEGDTLYGGFYTQDDIREIIAYAQVRGIDIVPEIDMPGHMLAAVSNYAGVSCFDETGWGSMFSSPVCPGKDSALEFCRNVYGELMELFPYKYVHIGGDEVEKTNWKKCPDCQKRMRENGLRTEEELQAWFIRQMESFFHEKGKELIGWDEIIEGGLSETATVMWWRNWAKDAPVQATAQGNRVICTPNENFYLNNQEDKNSIPNIYLFDLSDRLSPEQLANVWGVQGNLWCEHIPSEARMQYMAVPRLLAVAELGWADPAQQDLKAFEQRLSAQYERLGILGVNYRIPDLEGFHATNAFLDNDTIRVTCPDPLAEIRYTTDGSIPTLQSPVCDGSLAISETTELTFCTFRPGGKKGDVTRARFIKDTYAPSVLAAPSNPGLKAAWHEFKGDRCADIGSAPLNGTYSVEDVMIPRKVKGNIGLIIKGYFNAPQDDIYTFVLLSDDGSTLAIDGMPLVDNDGAHSAKEVAGQKALSKGYHPMEVRYFDQNGGILKLKVTGSDGVEIPFTHLYAF